MRRGRARLDVAIAVASISRMSIFDPRAAAPLLIACLVTSASAQEVGPGHTPGIGVKLRALDKQTARTRVIDAYVDEVTTFGTLRIETLACRAAPPLDPPEAKAYLRIFDRSVEAADQGRDRLVFSGWMFASDPAANPLEHAVYDVWPIACIAASPDSEGGAADQSPSD